MPTPARLASLLLALPLTALIACDWNEVETGKNGLVELIPDDCGQAGCDLDDGIAVGGTLTIDLDGVGDRDATGLRLVSSAPWVVDVISDEGGGFRPSFRILGTGAGRADLIVIDGAGYEVDYLPVEVASIAEVELDVDADGMQPLSIVGIDEAYQAPIGADLTLVAAGHAFGHQLTGDVQYLVELDEALARAMLSDSDVSRGHMHLTVPAGDHDLRITAPGGARKTVRIMGR